MCTAAPTPSSAPGSANASTCRASRETCAGVGAGAAPTVGASGAAAGVGGTGAIDVGLGVAVGAGSSPGGGGAAAALLDASARVRSARGSTGSWDCRVDQPLGGAQPERDGTPDDT